MSLITETLPTLPAARLTVASRRPAESHSALRPPAARAQSAPNPPGTHPMDNRIAAEDYLEALAAARYRLPVRQPRHGLRADHRGVCARRAQQPQGAAAAGGSARERRRLHGAWLHHGQRAAAGGDDACQRGHRQHPQRADRRRARAHPDAAHLGAHADHRERPVRHAQRLYPLGAGDVRPGRDAARDRQVGLRAAPPRPDQRRGGAGDGDRDDLALRPGLSQPAARGFG